MAAVTTFHIPSSPKDIPNIIVDPYERNFKCNQQLLDLEILFDATQEDENKVFNAALNLLKFAYKYKESLHSNYPEHLLDIYFKGNDLVEGTDVVYNLKFNSICILVERIGMFIAPPGTSLCQRPSTLKELKEEEEKIRKYNINFVGPKVSSAVTTLCRTP
jgi:hypothetical protein